MPERVEPETQRRQIEGAIESSGGAEAWSAPARRMVGDWMASSGEHLLSSRIDCHHDGCIARLRYRDRAALRAVTEAFEQKIEQWPGPKMQTPAHEVDGALSNEWIFFPPDDMRRQ